MGIIIITLLIISIISYQAYSNHKLSKTIQAQQDNLNKQAIDNELLKNTIKKETLVIEELQEELEREALKNRDVLSKKISSEVRMGNLSENLLPILKGCPYNIGNMIHVGKPIDYIVVDYDKEELVIVEVKTGNAKKNTHQRKIKKMIDSGRVYFEEILMKENGIEYVSDKRRDTKQVAED